MNLRVILDGYGDHWATSRAEMTDEGLAKQRELQPGIPDATLREFTWREIPA